MRFSASALAIVVVGSAGGQVLASENGAANLTAAFIDRCLQPLLANQSPAIDDIVQPQIVDLIGTPGTEFGFELVGHGDAVLRIQTGSTGAIDCVIDASLNALGTKTEIDAILSDHLTARGGRQLWNCDSPSGVSSAMFEAGDLTEGGVFVIVSSMLVPTPSAGPDVLFLRAMERSEPMRRFASCAEWQIQQNKVDQLMTGEGEAE